MARPLRRAAGPILCLASVASKATLRSLAHCRTDLSLRLFEAVRVRCADVKVLRHGDSLAVTAREAWNDGSCTSGQEQLWPLLANHVSLARLHVTATSPTTAEEVTQQLREKVSTT